MSIENMALYRAHAETICTDKRLIKAYFTVFRQNMNNPGACHISSATLYVLLKELGYNPELCLGEGLVDSQNLRFDHSWVEMDHDIYDSAISLDLQEMNVNDPIFKSHSLKTLTLTDNVYGSKDKTEADSVVKKIVNTGFLNYMDNAPYKNGAWTCIKNSGKELNLKLSIPQLRSKYTQEKWEIKTPYVF